MNKPDWDSVEKSLRHEFGSCKLKVDGIALTLSCVVLNRRLVIAWFIDGQFLGKWLNGDCIEGQKFARPSIKKLFSEKERKEFKRLGIKGMDKEITCYYWSWLSFQSLKRHLLKTCTDIEIYYD